VVAWRRRISTVPRTRTQPAWERTETAGDFVPPSLFPLPRPPPISLDSPPLPSFNSFFLPRLLPDPLSSPSLALSISPPFPSLPPPFALFFRHSFPSPLSPLIQVANAVRRNLGPAERAGVIGRRREPVGNAAQRPGGGGGIRRQQAGRLGWRPAPNGRVSGGKRRATAQRRGRRRGWRWRRQRRGAVTGGTADGRHPRNGSDGATGGHEATVGRRAAAAKRVPGQPRQGAVRAQRRCGGAHAWTAPHPRTGKPTTDEREPTAVYGDRRDSAATAAEPGGSGSGKTATTGKRGYRPARKQATGRPADSACDAATVPSPPTADARRWRWYGGAATGGGGGGGGWWGVGAAGQNSQGPGGTTRARPAS